jgi:hypothetical protein
MEAAEKSGPMHFTPVMVSWLKTQNLVKNVPKMVLNS